MVRNNRHHVTIAVTTPEKYLGLCVHSCGAPIHPAQYPMKNMALTMARFVLPLTFEAIREMRMDHGAVIQDDNHEAAIMPQPASRDSFKRQMVPARGGSTRAKATSVRFRGIKTHPSTPIQSMVIWTAPDGAVYSIVWYLSYPMLLMTKEANYGPVSRHSSAFEMGSGTRLYREHRRLHRDEYPKCEDKPRLGIRKGLPQLSH